VSELKKQGMYEVVNAVPLNELSREMFVYKVLDEMMSRQMYGLAEQVVSCVGIGEAPEEEEEEEEEDEKGFISHFNFLINSSFEPSVLRCSAAISNIFENDIW